MAATDLARLRRTYGGLRRPRSAGLGPLGVLSTGVWLLSIIVVILTVATAGLLPGVIVFAVATGLVSTVAVRDRHHRTVLQRVATRLAFAWAAHRGVTQYRCGPTGAVPYTGFPLPGLAAQTRASQWGTGRGDPFVLIHYPSTNDYAVVIAGEPEGGSLVDEDQIDSWVANWGAWLAGLGDEPGIVGAQVVLESVPDGGSRLARQIARRLDPDAHPVARAMLLEAQATYPAAASELHAWITLTFSGAGRGTTGRRSPAEVARDLATRLPGLLDGLAATGAGTVRLATATETAEAVLVSFDPDAQPLLDAARSAGEEPAIGWQEAGPVAAHEGWDVYRHNGAWSVSWVQSQPPRGVFHAQLLGRLLGPHADVDRKRVTLLLEPVSSARAAHIVEADRRNASVRASGGGKYAQPTARATDDKAAADRAAAEEAAGAGLIGVGMIVTATVNSVVKLPAARAAIDYLAPSARLTLRPADGAQASTFLAGLPIGLHLQRHLRVPTEIREGI